MFFIFICLLILALLDDWEDADKARERAKERRHQELMKQIKRKQLSSRRTRTIARDERGRFVAQEIIETDDDFDEDFDEDNYE